MQLKIALVQMHIAPSDPLKNLERIEALTAQAKEQGADLVVFPEDAVCGPLAGQTAFVRHAPAYLARMQALAVRHAVDLVPGTWTVADQGALYNQAHYIAADGTLPGWYRKVNLWDTEKVAIAPGPGANVFPTRFGPVGLTICWDIAFPELFAAMNKLGAQFVISPTYWSFPKASLRSADKLNDEVLLIDSLCTARAFENNILFAYCNAGGTLEGTGVDTVLSGRSQVTHPVHKVLAQCEGNDEEILVVDAEVPAPVAAA
ncbi:MAG: carbon-nitrogen hydrolase family protein [Flavobacteriales bacterium]|jgi:predicted amidohydrolase|nr:carbon-nitrogen hydrolase family protein [Flavobacteriales bacterium]